MEPQGPFDRVLAAARAGEGWALAELFRDLHPRIRRYLHTVEPGAADDLASDAWLDVVRSLERFRGEASDLRALAFSIARTRLNELREAERRAAEGPDRGETVEVTFEGPQTPMLGEPDAGLTQLDTEIALERVLALPLEQAELILLRVLGGLTLSEVARTLDRSVRSVRALQRDALAALAEATSEERTIT